ncbi:MAG: class I tRNA ligase family protein [Gemmatimonadetes bacterium]|nr:class I tRNA ligase family protein [Gemmatimonadota bacterium]
MELGEAIERFGADAFRYFLMREVPFDADGNFSWERFEERYNADLANAWGNLASRTISMIEKYCGATVPAAGPTSLDEGDAADIAAYHEAMNGENGFLLHEGLKAVWQSVARGNEYVDRQAPWKLAKDPAQRVELDATMAALARHLARHCVLLHPFMPVKTLELWRALGAPGNPCRRAIHGASGARRERMARGQARPALSEGRAAGLNRRAEPPAGSAGRLLRLRYAARATRTVGAAALRRRASCAGCDRRTCPHSRTRVTQERRRDAAVSPSHRSVSRRTAA